MQLAFYFVNTSILIYGNVHVAQSLIPSETNDLYLMDINHQLIFNF